MRFMHPGLRRGLIRQTDVSCKVSRVEGSTFDSSVVQLKRVAEIRLRTMTSSASMLTILLLVLQCGAPLAAAGKSQTFCPKTLSRPTCPDLRTYDKLDVTIYGGRWFEIGSTANFKNLREAGGICVVANYSLLEPPSTPAHEGPKLKVLNTVYRSVSPSPNVSRVISLGASQICSQAFSICAETDQRKRSSTSSSLAQGLTLISDVGAGIDTECPGPAAGLALALKTIKKAIKKIDSGLDSLSKNITNIQEATAQLGQGQGNATANVAALYEIITDANGTTIAIATAVGSIGSANDRVAQIAAELAGEGDGLSSAKLYKAVELISAGGEAITADVAQIEQSLGDIGGIAGLFLAPGTGQREFSGIEGIAEQNVSFAGKLKVSFGGSPPGNYWVLAVEEERGSNGGYAASLVYGCDQNAGGIEETLFVLSRTPSLPEATVKRLLARGAALGVTNFCSTPFIFTVHGPICDSNPFITIP